MYQLLKEQLIATIIEQIDSAVTLIDSGRAACVEPIQRSCRQARLVGIAAWGIVAAIGMKMGG
ncbi:MAG: hypothetical protein E5W26_19890 [Mesorhizobium sp.]|nr:MAG: hypothetical protein E5W26_19890 [Mesorhizobium sp.]